MKQTLVDDNVRSMFIRIGVRCNSDVVPHRHIFEESALRHSQGFLTLGRRDYPLEQLSATRGKVLLGLVNQEMLTNWIE
jgi:hypothetical protein